MSARIQAVVAGLVAAALYVSTLCPTVPAGDSGELITACHTLGVAHPPGYPLFTLIGAAADRVSDAGEPAARVNLGLALVGAVAAALTFLLARRVSGRGWPAAAGAATSALAVVTWRHASGAEVFGLNVALNVGAVLAVLALHDALGAGRPPGRRAVVVGLLFGLGMSNHHTTSLVALTCVAALVGGVIVGRYRAAAATRAVGWALVGAVVGLLPYLYLPWAAARDPLLAWGDTATWDGFWHHFLRRDYGTGSLMSSAVGAADPSPWDAPAFLARRLGPLTAWVAPVALAAGLVLACVRRWRHDDDLVCRFGLGLCLALAVVTGPLFFALFNAPLEKPVMQGVVERFGILPLAFVGVLVAWALARLPVAGRVRDGLCVGVVALLALANHGEVDMSHETFARDFGRDVLASVPEGALFLSRSDLVTNTVEYQQFCLGARPDVLVVDQEKLTYPWYAAAAARRDPRFTLPWPGGVDAPPRFDGLHVTSEALIAAHVERMPVAIVQPMDDTWRRSFEEVPRGLVRVMHALGSAPTHAERAPREAELLAGFADVDPQRYPHDGFEREGCARYADAIFAMGYTAEQVGDVARAADLYERATRLDPERWAAWLNLGVVRQRLGDPAGAVEAWRACLAAWEGRPSWAPAEAGPPVADLRAAIEQARAMH